VRKRVLLRGAAVFAVEHAKKQQRGPVELPSSAEEVAGWVLRGVRGGRAVPGAAFGGC
jgi:hypothetical protein